MPLSSAGRLSARSQSCTHRRRFGWLLHHVTTLGIVAQGDSMLQFGYVPAARDAESQHKYPLNNSGEFASPVWRIAHLVNADAHRQGSADVIG